MPAYIQDQHNEAIVNVQEHAGLPAPGAVR
jgi:hypothetical protein